MFHLLSKLSFESSVTLVEIKL